MLARKRHERSTLERARDELFSHIHRCEVIGATEEQQVEWMEDTLHFMAERYPDLTPRELNQLKELGLRFCQPIAPRGADERSESDEEADAA
jgi:hypothetical protein